MLQSSYLANGLERLIESDFSAQKHYNAEDFCSIIIEHVIKAHRCDTDKLPMSYRGRETYR